MHAEYSLEHRSSTGGKSISAEIMYDCQKRAGVLDRTSIRPEQFIVWEASTHIE